MEPWEQLLTFISGGLIVPLLGLFKRKVIDEPVVNYLLMATLAIGFGYLSCSLAQCGLPINELIIRSMGLVATGAGFTHATVSQIQKINKAGGSQ